MKKMNFKLILFWVFMGFTVMFSIATKDIFILIGTITGISIILFTEYKEKKKKENAISKKSE